jgi:hypothetical protein
MTEKTGKGYVNNRAFLPGRLLIPNSLSENPAEDQDTLPLT